MKEKIIKYIERYNNTTQSLGHTDRQLKQLDIKFIRTLSGIIETTPGIHNQSQYIAETSLQVAGGLSLSAMEAEDIFYAGFLIQLGKVTLTQNLRASPFLLMSAINKYKYLGHAVEGEDLLQVLSRFKSAATLIRYQYEHYDGQGFPDGLRQHNIPMGSRIISVVSDYAECLNGLMTGAVMSTYEARNLLIIRKGTHYDPDVVDVFVNVLKGVSVDELQNELAKMKRIAMVTKQWKKGLLIREKAAVTKNIKIVEISLPQLKVGMKVESIYFGLDIYMRNCIVDQSIIDNLATMKKTSNQQCIIKIGHNT